MVNKASTFLKLVQRKVKRFSQKDNSRSPKWYDRECSFLKKRLSNLANLLNKKPNDSYVRGSWNTVKKEYRRLLRSKKIRYEQEIIDDLVANSNNPKEFWKKVKQMNKKSLNNSNCIPLDKWIEHFSLLNRNDPSKIHENNPFTVEVMNALKNKYSGNSNCPILDKNFTIREILGGIKLLKSGKASAYDIVDNDLIKATASSISPM